MSKIYKVQMYLLDVNEVYDNIDEALSDCENRSEMKFAPFDIECKKVEWDDDIDINALDATKEMWDKYFKQ